MAIDEGGAPPDLSLPAPVLEALSIPGIDAAGFRAVAEALGPLPVEGQVELANQLISARGQYVAHRMSVCDSDSLQGRRRERLEEIGVAAARLARLLHRDGTDHQPSNLHPAITLALPHLGKLAAEHGPDQSWDGALSRLDAMLADLEKVGMQAETIFPRRFPKKHGGKRREGHDPATGLVERLIEIYGNIRAQYPESGPAPAYGAPLRQFVRAGLAFAVSLPPGSIDSNGRRWQVVEARFVETDLPRKTRITDNSIRGTFDRLHKSSRKQS